MKVSFVKDFKTFTFTKPAIGKLDLNSNFFRTYQNNIFIAK